MYTPFLLSYFLSCCFDLNPSLSVRLISHQLIIGVISRAPLTVGLPSELWLMHVILMYVLCVCLSAWSGDRAISLRYSIWWRAVHMPSSSDPPPHPPSSSSFISHTHQFLPPFLNLSISQLAFASSPLASVPSTRALITSLSLWHSMTVWLSLPDTSIFSSSSVALLRLSLWLTPSYSTFALSV